MWIQFNNTDSAGDPVTRRATVEHPGTGERTDLEPASTGRVQVDDVLGQYLDASEAWDVSVYEPDDEEQTDDEPAADSADDEKLINE